MKVDLAGCAHQVEYLERTINPDPQESPVYLPSLVLNMHADAWVGERCRIEHRETAQVRERTIENLSTRGESDG